jgi:riboflavin kinase/FMN adenylyltransferase
MSEPERHASFPPRSTVITVGTFDGVHRGHLALLDALGAVASDAGLPRVVVTFHPHPLRVVRPDTAPALLTTRTEKVELLAQAGAERVVFLRFDTTLAGYAPDRFVEEILVERLGLARLVIGYDHGFGRDRSGDADTLRAIGARLGFAVDVVPPVRAADGAISSTRIRNALEAGDVRAAARGLGRPYSCRGLVVRGDGRGRALGYPTANLRIDDAEKLMPAEGIYAVLVHGREVSARGLLHLGPRPTFPDAAPTVEVHLLDFDGDLYGESIEVSLCERLRGVQRFETVDALVRAMDGDRAAARALFGRGDGACGPTGVPLA